MSSDNNNKHDDDCQPAPPPRTTTSNPEEEESAAAVVVVDANSMDNDGGNNSLVDITNWVVSCAEQLTMAEPFLCRQETFQLQDAMAATQLMDRKMDSCEVPAHLAAPMAHQHNKNLSTTEEEEPILFPRPCPERLSDPFVPLPWTELTLEQASVIVTHQLARLQALFSGASVGESIYTCLYAHKPILCEMEECIFGTDSTAAADDEEEKEKAADATKAKTLKHRLQAILEKGAANNVYCAQLALFTSTCALVEITEVFRGIVLNADIYEEEDFVCNTHDVQVFSLNSSERHPDKNSLQLYLETTVEILRQISETDQNRRPLEILRLTLTYLNGTLVYCSKMGKLSRADLAETLDTMRRLAVSLGEGLESLWGLFTEQSPSSRQSSTLENVVRDKELVSQVFDSYTNRAMFGNTPVRKVSFLPIDQSLEKLLSVTKEWDWAVCGLLISGSNLARIGRMLQRFSYLNILSRSLIVLNLYFEDMLLGKHHLQSLIVDHMRQWEHVPNDLVQNEHAKVLLNRLAKPVYDTLKVQVANRNRQRAYIEAAMFQEWTSLQNEASLIDSNYRRENNLDNSTPPVFGFYVLSYLLKLMNQHLACGIEVGLFCGHDEICASFWYRDFLLAALIKKLTQMRKGKEHHKAIALLQEQQQRKEQQEAAATASSSAKGKKGKKKNNRNKADNGNKQQQKQKQQPANMKTLEDIEDGLELQMLEAKRKVCQGLVRFIVAIRRAGYFTFPDYKFTSRRTIFERRFAVFGTIRQPSPLTFDDYLEGSDGSSISVEDMCRSASECFRVGRTMLEKILDDVGTINVPFAPVKETEARSLLKVCVGNLVYLMKFGQLVGGDKTNNGSIGEKAKVLFEFDFDVSPEFCILKTSG